MIIPFTWYVHLYKRVHIIHLIVTLYFIGLSALIMILYFPVSVYISIKVFDLTCIEILAICDEFRTRRYKTYV